VFLSEKKRSSPCAERCVQLTSSMTKTSSTSYSHRTLLTGESHEWIHMTQRELSGIRALVEFLGSLEAANRHVPSDVQSPDELLANAKVINYMN